MAQFDKYGQWINHNYRSSLPVSSFRPTQRHATTYRRNVWQRMNDFVVNMGEWIDDNRDALSNNISIGFYFLAWIGLAIGVIVQLFSSFWGALLSAIIGGVIVYYAAGVGVFILLWVLQVFFYIVRYIFYNIYTLLIATLLVLGLCFSNQNSQDKNRTTITSTSAILEPNYYCDVNTTLKVREYPWRNAKEIGQLKRYEEVYVYSIDNNFAKINFKGRFAYVSAEYLKLKVKSVNMPQSASTTTVNKENTKIKDLIGTTFSGYNDQRALQDKLGFWCGDQFGYGEGKFIIERWENTKVQKLWLVLVEKTNNDKSVIRDILPFERKSVGDIGTFPVYNKNTKQWSDYMMVQVSSSNELVKIYDVDLQNGKIISKNPESYWGKVQTAWDSY
jgi:hypothetical protein